MNTNEELKQKITSLLGTRNKNTRYPLELIREVVEVLNSSNVSVIDFSKYFGLDVKLLYRWKKIYSKKTSKKFVPIKIKDPLFKKTNNKISSNLILEIEMQRFKGVVRNLDLEGLIKLIQSV